MSCDRDRRDWWDHWQGWFENLSQAVRLAMRAGLRSFISRRVRETLKGGSGPRLSAPGGKGEGSGRGGGVSMVIRKGPTSSKPGKATAPSKRPRPRYVTPPERIYERVKQAAVLRENDWSPEERDQLAWKTRMLRRWLRTTGNAPLTVDPAHGDSDLPKVSSQAAFAAVYDWMQHSEVDMSSPLDAAYKALWQEDNQYSQAERIELHKLIEETEAMSLHPVAERGRKQPAADKKLGAGLQKQIKQQKTPSEVSAWLKSQGTARVPAEAGVPLARPEPPREDVYFSAVHPRQARVDEWVPLLVYSHIAALKDLVHLDALQLAREKRKPSIQTAPPARLPFGAPITVVPYCEGVEFQPDVITFFWKSSIQRAEFRLRADPSLAQKQTKGQIAFYAEGVLVGLLNLGLDFADTRARGVSRARRWDRARMFTDSQVFISYSHKDTRVVTLMRDIMHGLGYHTLIDIDDLHTGQIWNDELMEMIERADVFQLFWSKNSARSDYVKKEWHHAMKCQKLIAPVYWHKPIAPKPPRELEKIHFGYLPIGQLKPAKSHSAAAK